MSELQQSMEIYQEAVATFKPYAVVLMLSGGNDSLACAEVARQLGIKVDFVLHGHTGTGIQETLEHVRKIAPLYGGQYIEASAGNAYEEYVLRKGFFGIGNTAHSYAYHILKHQRFQTAISQHIRHKKRGRNVLLLNGARLHESNRRKHNLTQVFNIDPSVKSNIWVNLIHHWKEVKDFVADAPINPVTQKLCRSGECLCGTMQSKAERVEIAYYYPEWDKWMSGLEQQAKERGFTWGWGEHSYKPNKHQLSLFQPACVSCKEVEDE